VFDFSSEVNSSRARVVTRDKADFSYRFVALARACFVADRDVQVCFGRIYPTRERLIAFVLGLRRDTRVHWRNLCSDAA
jgi:hypothetical protein